MDAMSIFMLVLACVGPIYGRMVSMELDKDFFDKPTDHAKVARQVVHSADWAAFGTNSIVKELRGFPMVNVISVADSKRDAPSTGRIYFYLTNLDYTGQDLMRDNRLTVLFSQDQDLSCSKNGVDPMEPTCARIIISGKAVVMDNGTTEYAFARDAFFDRHPAAANWLKTHAFYLCKLEITNIAVLDWYGGPHQVTADDYYKANLDGEDVSENRLAYHTEDSRYGHYIDETDHIRIRVNKKTKEIDIDI